MFDGLITGRLADIIGECVKPEQLMEIRLRLNRRLLLLTSSAINPRVYPKSLGKPYIVSKQDIDGIIARATNYSPYSVSEEMAKGYIPCKAVRIGVGGEGVFEDGKLLNIKNPSSLVIRIPHQIRTAANGIIDSVLNKSDSERADNFGIKNTLIISPPACGKTTVLRELARILSAKTNVVVIDERYELAAVSAGECVLDVGDSEVISGVPKVVAYEACIRAMNPEVIVTDELFKPCDIAAICDVMRSGVKAIASVHGGSVEDIASSEIYAPLLKAFDLAIVLGRNPVGSVKDIVNL